MTGTVLVIGGTGFLGRATVQALAERGHDVTSMSRSGTAEIGRGISGDVRVEGLALSGGTARELRRSVTHIIGCFGSVDWRAGPRDVQAVHVAGTANVLDFAASCERLERLVHVSSVLALGQAKRVIRNADLDVGQRFRNWYEYGKFHAELRVRTERRVPWRIVRLGPVLGVVGGDAPSLSFGILSALPYLLQGGPVPLARRGDFDCFPCDAMTAGAVLALAAQDRDRGPAWTYFDERRPTLLQAFGALCRPWNTVPRIVDLPFLAAPLRVVAPRMGVPRELLAYTEPWVRFDDSILSELPRDLPPTPDGYLVATGDALRRTSDLAFV